MFGYISNDEYDDQLCCGLQVLVTAFTVVPSRSGAVRTFEQRTVLEQFNPRCVAVSLSGYIFFGSSVKISDKVMEVRRVLSPDNCYSMGRFAGDVDCLSCTPLLSAVSLTLMPVF